MIPWHKIRPLLARIDEVTDDARSIAGADQTAAYYRHLFEGLSLPIDSAHPANVYAAIVTLELARQAFAVAHLNGVIDCEATDAAGGILRTLIFAVAEHAPAEARS